MVLLDVLVELSAQHNATVNQSSTPSWCYTCPYHFGTIFASLALWSQQVMRSPALVKLFLWYSVAYLLLGMCFSGAVMYKVRIGVVGKICDTNVTHRLRELNKQSNTANRECRTAEFAADYEAESRARCVPRSWQLAACARGRTSAGTTKFLGPRSSRPAPLHCAAG